MDENKEKLKSLLRSNEARFAKIISLVISQSDFSAKYDVSGTKPLVYLYTTQPSKFVFAAELFAVAHLPSAGLSDKQEGNLVFHSMFDEVIKRYTNELRKPNCMHVLQETRSSDICYQVVVKFEAVPEAMARHAESYWLLREFQILQHIWESYRAELVARTCTTDHLIGFPMLFEFKNIVGSPKYDFPKNALQEFHYFNPSGTSEMMHNIPISPFGFGTETKNISSSLSYMTVEKVGPSVVYLMDLMRSQGHRFSLSSALKIYDQLVCRLIIMHKYGVIHGDMNPSCLNFGFREASNVLYVNSFDKAVLASSQDTSILLHHDRFVSHLQAKEKLCHFVGDLESAFYILIYLLLDRTPWDSKLIDNRSHRQQVRDSVTSKSRTTDLKTMFWQSPETFNWVMKDVTHEHHDLLYRNFSADILETLYASMKETISACKAMPLPTFQKEIFITGSTAYNCYFGIRKVVASYFRFETLSQSLKDVLCSRKLEMVINLGKTDKRIGWDLSYWCWNYIDVDTRKRNCIASTVVNNIHA